LPPDVEYNLLRIAQEAVSNSVKHSGARTIEVVLESTAELVRLSIRDDGSGFAAGENNGQPGHYGLIGMKERANEIGGRFEVASRPGKGTTVRVVVPAPKAGSVSPRGGLVRKDASAPVRS
ncbi:MAG: sensor histidine kinase, partial [Bryobacteraceae bacterium]